ncbi:MAG: TonB-dependent receptor, partial [Bacteroidaceae bacterium]|nr:TonB-dependent receptor [Bacteroidaceae bacterium]
QVQGKILPSELLDRNTWVRSLSFGYTFIHQTKHDAEGVVKSNVAMEYLRHKFVANLSHRIYRHLSISWDFRWQEREGSYLSGGKLVPYHPYFMLDAKMKWEAPRYQLYVQATNLTNHRYYDLGSVPQPGICVMAGARFKLKIKR